MNTTPKTRALALIAGAILSAGLLTGNPAPATANRAAEAASVPQCRSGDVLVTFGHLEGAAGTTYGRMRIKNTSKHACRTGGYGGISLVGYGAGVQIGAPSDRVKGKVRSIVLKPGQKVKSQVALTTAQNYPRKKCHPVPVDGFRVYIPNETRSVFVGYRTTGCATNGIHLLRHKPYHR